MTAFDVIFGILAVSDAVCLIAVAAHFARRITALEKKAKR